MCKILPPKNPVDSDEEESLSMTFGAALYQSGGAIDYRIAAAGAVLGIALPRLIQWLDEREEKENAKHRIPAKVDAANAELIRLQNELKELEKKKASLDVKPIPIINYPENTN